MKQDIKAVHWKDQNGMPAGGVTEATGMLISWQNGPLGRGEDRVEPNGCFVETVISAALDRLNYYQASGFSCHENAQAIESLTQALEWLNERTAKREARNVEGTHAK